MKTIAIANQKGGVGKTTTAMSLGAALAKLGKRVLLLDLDPQGNLSDYLGFEPDGNATISELLIAVAGGLEVDPVPCIRRNEPESLDYIPANISLSNADMQLLTAVSRETVLARLLQAPIFSAYDYILIDCLPSLGIITVNAFTAADSVMIPVQAQKFALDGIESLMNVLRIVQRQLNPKLHLEGILLTMKDRTNICENVSSELKDRYGEVVYSTEIPRSVEAANSTAYRRSLVSYHNKLGKEYEQLAQEVLAKEER